MFLFSCFLMFFRVLFDMKRVLTGGVDLNYVIPINICVMINVINDAGEQVRDEVNLFL